MSLFDKPRKKYEEIKKGRKETKKASGAATQAMPGGCCLRHFDPNLQKPEKAHTSRAQGGAVSHIGYCVAQPWPNNLKEKNHRAKCSGEIFSPSVFATFFQLYILTSHKYITGWP